MDVEKEELCDMWAVTTDQEDTPYRLALARELHDSIPATWWEKYWNENIATDWDKMTEDQAAYALWWVLSVKVHPILSWYIREFCEPVVRVSHG